MAMGHYGVKTKLSPEEVIQKAKTYFSGQMGLTIVEEGACCISFEGGGGFVEIAVTQEEDGKTDVDLTTREWMFDVQQFMGLIGSKGR